MTNKDTKDELAKFQSKLLAVLAEEIPINEMCERLKEDLAFKPYSNQIARWQPRMIEVAAQLVKKWGKRGRRGEGL